MYCLPACIACTTAGSCPKGELPAVPVSTEPKPTVVRDRPGQMIQLGCGHEIDAYGATVQFGKRDRFWCEIHGRYSSKSKAKTASKVLPQQPLF